MPSSSQLLRRLVGSLILFVSPFSAQLAHCKEAPRKPLASPSVDVAPLELATPPAFILLGGGYDPVSNQISISQDLESAQGLFGKGGIALFAAGNNSPIAAQEDKASESSLDGLLEELFGDPAAVEIEFRRSRWSVDGPSTAPHALDLLEQALSQGSDDLLVYAAGHGEPGETPQDCGLSLWGGWSILAEDLGSILDGPDVSRPMHLVLTSCYGGGFADIALHGASRPAHATGLSLASTRLIASSERNTEAPADPVHCGLFAAPWDDESSGCDPDPDRRSQESYALHFLGALSGKDREGNQLRAEVLDLNSDGRIGLLEAHTHARITSRSIDLPTTTSEYWLRLQFNIQPPAVDPAFDVLPEERAVVASLGSSLGLATESEVETELDRLDRELEELAGLVEEAQLDADDAYWALRITLLERWPELSQAWSGKTSDLVRRHHDAILELATESGPALRYQATMARWEKRATLYDKVRLQRAQVARVMRSWDTLHLAGALRLQGGPAWTRYLELLRCERWAPRVVGR